MIVEKLWFIFVVLAIFFCLDRVRQHHRDYEQSHKMAQDSNLQANERFDLLEKSYSRGKTIKYYFSALLVLLVNFILVSYFFFERMKERNFPDALTAFVFLVIASFFAFNILQKNLEDWAKKEKELSSEESEMSKAILPQKTKGNLRFAIVISVLFLLSTGLLFAFVLSI